MVAATVPRHLAVIQAGQTTLMERHRTSKPGRRLRRIEDDTEPRVVLDRTVPVAVEMDRSALHPEIRANCRTVLADAKDDEFGSRITGGCRCGVAE